MHHPIAFCRLHGFFPATAIGIGNASITVAGIGTVCPRCGAKSEIVPGTYEAFGNRLNLLLDKSVSPEALDQLRAIAERLQRNEITPQQATTEAEKVAPKAGRLFDIADWSDQAKATLYAAVIGAAAVLGAAKLAGTTGAPQTVVERVIERRTDRLQDSTALPYIPIPTPRPKEPR